MSDAISDLCRLTLKINDEQSVLEATYQKHEDAYYRVLDLQTRVRPLIG